MALKLNVKDVLLKSVLVGVVIIVAAFARGEWMLVLALIGKDKFQFFSSDNQEQTTLNGLLQQWRLQNVGLYVGLSTAASFVVYIFLAGGLEWHYYIKRRNEAKEWKCQPDKFLTTANELHGIMMGSLNLLTGSILSGFIACYIINGGYTSLYYNISDRGYLHFLISIPLVFLWNECAGYYSHRMFHIPCLYKTIHKWHHRYHQPTPLSATAMHPIEFFTYQLYYAAPAFLFPVHVGVFISILLYDYYYGVVDHSGIMMDALWPWQAPTIYHDNHHKYFHCNFGINTCLFDWLHDTMRHNDRIYGEDVFGGHGKIVEKSKNS